MLCHVLVSGHHEVVVLVMPFGLGALLGRRLLTLACPSVCRSLNQSQFVKDIDDENETIDIRYSGLDREIIVCDITKVERIV